eukprot:9106827-Ditylum_brightwellii.AAC.1
MVHSRDHIRTDETVLVHDAHDSDDGADKHLIHLSQGFDCHLTRENDDVDDGIDNGDDDGIDNSVDNSVDNGVDNGVDNSVEHGDDDSVEHGVEDDDVEDEVDDGVDDGVDNSVEDGDDDNVEDGVDGADKHLTHLSQGVDCHLTRRSKQNKHAVGNKDNDVENDVEDKNGKLKTILAI